MYTIKFKIMVQEDLSNRKVFDKKNIFDTVVGKLKPSCCLFATCKMTSTRVWQNCRSRNNLLLY